jgi:hypothetical protein
MTCHPYRPPNLARTALTCLALAVGLGAALLLCYLDKPSPVERARKCGGI